MGRASIATTQRDKKLSDEALMREARSAKHCGTSVKRTVAALWLSLIASSCLACTCNGLPGPIAAFRGSDAVFVGTVLSVKHQKEPTSNLYVWLKHRMRVEEAWKGASAGKTLTVYTSTGPCGTGFHKGNNVIIYAIRMKQGRHRGELSAGTLCSRSSASRNTVTADCDSLGPPASARSR